MKEKTMRPIHSNVYDVQKPEKGHINTKNSSTPPISTSHPRVDILLMEINADVTYFKMNS